MARAVAAARHKAAAPAAGAGGSTAARLVMGTVRRDRAGLLRTTALQAAAALAIAAAPPLAGGRAVAQPASTARPQGGQVVAGQASIGQTSARTTVDQASQRAAVNWTSFDVGSGHAVQFNQPNASAVVLNRVTGPDPSQIAGSISANGQVVITNQSGVMFHRGAQVNTAGLIVSAAGITDTNFMAGRMVFDQAPRPDAQVSNAGNITVKEAGLAALVAPRVANSGTINARMGRAVLAGAETHTLDLYGDGLLSIDVTRQVRQAPRGADGKPVTALVTNTGTIVADGGTVTLTAAAADGIVQNLVEAGGQIRANSVGNRQGRIEVAGTGGGIVVEGQLGADGNAPGARGGTVVLNATGTLVVAQAARVTADGDSGGGLVAVGTTQARARGGPGVTGERTAQRVSVANGAQLSANARRQGQGGNVTLLATGATTMDGSVAARGGERGGDGGFVEVSGGKVGLNGRVDTTAPRGRVGNILLDPYDLVITDAQENVTPTTGGPPQITYGAGPGGGADPSQTSFVRPATLQALSGNVELQANHDIRVASNVTLSGSSSSPFQGLTLTAGRDINVNPGVRISVTGQLRLTAAASGAGTFADSSGAVVTGAGSALTGSSIFVSSGTRGITFNGNVGDASTFRVDLQSTGGPVSQALGSSTLIADTLTGRASQFTLDSPTNQVSIVGPNVEATVGDFSLTTLTARTGLRVETSGGSFGIRVPDRRAVTLAADSLTLTNVGGPAITALGGTVTLQPLSAGQPLELTTGAKTFGALSVTGTELASVRTNGSGLVGTLRFGSPAAGSLTLAGGTIDLGAGSTANRLELLSGGDVTQGSGSALAVQTLSGQARSVNLPNSNFIPTLDGFTTTGDFALHTGSGLLVSSPVRGANVNLSSSGISGTAADNMVLAADVTATAVNGVVRLDTSNGNLAASGQLVQTGGIVTGNELTGASNAVTLNSANRIAQLGTYTTQGDFRLSNAQSLNIVGSLASIAGDVTLNIAGALTESLIGSVNGRTLSGSAASVLLDNFTNDVDVLGQFTTTGPFNLTAAGSLTVNGPVSGSAVTLSSGNVLTLVGNVAGTAVTLNSLNATNQDVGSIITAGTLNGQAGSEVAASATLIGQNRVDALGNYAVERGFSTISDFTLNNVQPLRISGTVRTSPNNPTQPASGTVRITAAGDITQDAGSLISTAALTGNAPSASFTSLNNEVQSLAGFDTSAGGLSLFTKLTLAQIPGAGTATSPLRIDSTNSVPTGQQITLRADGMLFQGAGQGGPPQLSAPQGTVALAPLTAGRRVELIGGFGGGADVNSLSLSQAGLDTISTGTLQVGVATPDPSPTGPINIGNAGQAISLAGRAGTLRLVSAGAVTEGAGATLAVPTITGAAASASLPGANDIGTLGAFTTTGAFALNSAPPLSVIGPVTAGTQGSISSSGGVTVRGNVTAPDLTLATTAGSSLTLESGTVTAVNAGAGTIRLNVTGNVTQAGTNGVLVTDLLQGSAGSLSLPTALNQVASVGPFSITTGTGGFLLRDGQSLAVAGNIFANDATLDVIGNLAINSRISGNTVTLTARGNAQAGTGNITEGAAGQVTATTLQGSAVSAPLGGANQVGTLAGFSTAAGFQLRNAASAFGGSGALVVTGPVVDGTSVTLGTQGPLTIRGDVQAPSVSLTANRFTTSSGTFLRGTITQELGTVSGAQVSLLADDAVAQVGGTVAAGTLTGASGRIAANLVDGTTRLSSTGNLVGTLGNFSSIGGFTLQDGQALQVAGTVQDATRVTLSAAGAITQAPGSSIRTGALSASSTGGSVILGAAGNQVTGLGASSSAGDFALESSSASLDVTGTVVAGPGGHTLTLTTDKIQFQPGGSLSAVGGTVALAPFSNGPFTLDSFVPASSVVAAVTANVLQVGTTASGPLTISGAFNLANVGTLDLRSGGAVTEAAGGSLQVARLTGQAASATLNGDNRVTTLGDFSAVTGAFALTNAQALTVAGNVSAPDLTLATTAGGLTLASGTVTGTTTVRLNVAGDVAQSGGAVVTGLLQGSAASLSLPSTANRIANFGPFLAPGGVFLRDGQSLAVVGTIDPPDVTMDVVGDLAINSSIFGNNVTLTATGNITEGAAGRVFATTLQGSAASATLGQANQVGTLAGFTTTGGFTLNSGVSGFTPGANALAVTGPVSDATSIALTTQGPLNLQGNLTAPSVTLTANRFTSSGSSAAVFRGTITQSAGTVSGSTGASLTAADTISQTGGAIVTGGTLSLTAGSTIGQTGGTVTAVTLTGSSGSSTGLPSVANQVGQLSDFTSRGGFTLATGQALRLTGTVSDDTSVSLTTTNAGGLTLAGTITGPSSSGISFLPAVTLTATGGAIAQPSGSIQARSLTGSAAAGASLTRDTNQVAALGSFNSGTGDFALTDAAATLDVTGPVVARPGGTLTLTADRIQIQPGSPGGSLTASGGTVVLAPLSNNPFQLSSFVPAGTTAAVTADTLRVGRADGGPVGISGAFNMSNVGTLDLRSGAAITETTGASLQVGRLVGGAASATLDGPNRVGTLGAFATTGAFSLSNAQGLTVEGPVQGGTAVRLSAAGGTLALAGFVTAPDVSLTATGTGGGLTQSGFAVTGTTSVRISVAGDVTLGGGQIASPQVSLTAGGAVTQFAFAGGSIQAGTLTGSTGADVSLASDLNQVGALGSFSSAGSFALTNGVPLDVTGAVSAGAGRTLSLTGARIRLQPGGSLSAPQGTVALLPLPVGLTLESLLPSGAAVSAVTADTLRVGSTIGGQLAISGALNLSGVNTLDVRSGGPITEAAGASLQVGRLTGSSAGATTLDGPNRIGILGDFATRGGFSLQNAQALTVAGAVTDGTGTVRLATTAGDMAVGGSVTAPRVTLDASGTLSLARGGSIASTADFAGLRAGGTIVLLGDASAPSGRLNLDAGGHIEQGAGRIAASLLTGSAVELVSLPSAANAVGTLGAFGLTGSTFVLVNGQPLVVQGPVVSGTIRIDAAGLLLLADGGRLVTGDAALRVLPGQGGTGVLAQNGSTLVVSPDGSATALQLALPDAGGGLVSLNGLQAPGANLVLVLGTGGAAVGNANLGNLLVVGSGGSADLFGQVRGLGGFDAATVSTIQPRFDQNYLFNSCAIASASCVPVREPIPPEGPGFIFVFEQVPKAFQDTLLGALLRTGVIATDLFTLGIVRDPSDPNLVLPNISDRDY